MADTQNRDHQVLVKSMAMTQSLYQRLWRRWSCRDGVPLGVGGAVSGQARGSLLGLEPLSPSPGTLGCSPLHPGRWPQPRREEPGTLPRLWEPGASCPALTVWAQALGLYASSGHSTLCKGWAEPGTGPPQTPGPGPPHPTAFSGWGWPLGSAEALPWGCGPAPQQGAGVSCGASQ